jgi:hypothetical protein
LGKNICSVVGVDEDGRVVLRRRMRRQTVHTFAAKLPACTVAMEACCGAPSWAPAGGPGTHSEADVARVCAAVCEGAEERRS